MNINIAPKYDKISTTDTHVVMCFFSPMLFKKPLQNIQYNISRLEEANIPYTIVELLYPGQQQQIKNSIIVKSNTIIFSKENLWNISEKYIPQQYTKLIFLDSDIIFNKSDWLDKSSALLDEYSIIQSIEYAYRDIVFEDLSKPYIDIDITDFNTCKTALSKAISKQEKIVLGQHQPGFAIGIKRNIFHKINGFCDYGITGCSDVLFWLSIRDFNTHEVQKYIEKVPQVNQLQLAYTQNMRKYISFSDIGYNYGCVGLHLQHGKETNRFYQTRNLYIPDKFQFFYNNYGVLEIISFDKDKKDMTQYWIDRKEDE